jgi:hypothetical protein
MQETLAQMDVLARYWPQLACASGLWFALAGHARAHDAGLSTLTLGQDGARGWVEMVVEDTVLPEARRARSQACDASRTVALALDGQPLAIELACARREAGHTAYAGTFDLPRAGRLTNTVPLLAELPRGHRSFARVLDREGRVLGQQLLERDADRLSVPVSAPASSRGGVLAFTAVAAALLGGLLLRRAPRAHA